MALKKTVEKTVEKPIEKTKEPKSETVKIKFLSSYFGSHGIFRKSEICEMKTEIAERFIKDKVAEKC